MLVYVAPIAAQTKDEDSTGLRDLILSRRSTVPATLEPVPSNSLTSFQVDDESWAYVGKGEFWAWRSSRTGRIEIEFDTALFVAFDSTLDVSGRVFEGTTLEALSSVQLLLGPFSEVTLPDSTRGACIEIRELSAADSKGHFRARFKIRRGDYLCFAMPERGESSGIQMLSSAIFEVGKLLEQIQAK